MSDVYRAIADPTRRQIMDLLAVRDGITLFGICGAMHDAGVSASRQAISQHLAVLEEAGLVTAQRLGRTKLHHLKTGPLREVLTRWPVDGKDHQ